MTLERTVSSSVLSNDTTLSLVFKDAQIISSSFFDTPSLYLHVPATIFSFVFIDGEAGKLGDIAHSLQALAQMEHHLRLAEHGCSEFFGCRRSGTAHGDAEITQIIELNDLAVLQVCYHAPDHTVQHRLDVGRSQRTGFSDLIAQIVKLHPARAHCLGIIQLRVFQRTFTHVFSLH